MSEKHRNAQKSMPQSRKLFKYQKRKIRRYLKRVRWRRKRRQRYFLYGLALAVSMYLASIWKMRERIWSIREMDVIEYELPEGERAENGAEEAEAEVFSVWTCTGCIHVLGEYMEDAGTDLVDPRDGCDRV